MSMTENEAIKYIKNMAFMCGKHEKCQYGHQCTTKCLKATEMAIQALEEIQQYRAIGTIEEIKALKEKSVAKKAEVNEFDYGEGYVCGECESFLHYVDNDDEHIRTNYCCHCGTKIDWQ